MCGGLLHVRPVGASAWACARAACAKKRTGTLARANPAVTKASRLNLPRSCPLQRVKGRFVKRTDLDLEHLTLEESVPAAGPEGQGTTTASPAAAAASAVAASPPQS